MRIEYERVNVLGVGISAVNMPQALAHIDDWIARGEQRYVCLSTVYGVMECQRDLSLRQTFNRSGLTPPDGMPMVWLSRLRGHPLVERVYGPDLMLALCQRSLTRGYRHYLYGGADGVASQLKTRLESKFPGLQIVGIQTPPFRPLTPDEDAEVVGQINAAEPSVVWVGLGTPKQDHWMANHIGKVTAPVLIGVGAAFDFHSGRKKQAPRWMQRKGLEWVFRLSQEPARLWRRYLVDNTVFLGLSLLQLAGIKHYPHPTSEPAS